MVKRNQLIKILVVVSLLLCGCSSTSAFHSQTLVLKQVDTGNQFLTLTTKTVHEVWEVGEMPEMVYAEYEEGMEGIKWIASYVEGKLATVSEDFVVTYDSNGNQISKTAVIGSRQETEAVAPKMQFGGSVSVGSEFYPTMVTYGIDCAGCYVSPEGTGGSSAGVTLGYHSVRQPDGTMREGIKYGDYYIVAADPNIPLCSVITVYDHGFSGEGLVPGVPFKAIVLDRGGAIKGSILDLFKGSQGNTNISNDRSAHTKVVIERVGGKNGRNACKL